MKGLLEELFFGVEPKVTGMMFYTPWLTPTTLGSKWADDGDSVVFESTLPGVKREELEVEVDGEMLVISRGEKTYSLKIPAEADKDQIKVKLGLGILTVRIPKIKKDKRKIVVE